MASQTVSEARASLPELLTRVQHGEEITITRHGQPVAVLVRPDVLRLRRASDALAGADAVHELLSSAARAPHAKDHGLTSDRAEELIAAIRVGRDAR